ncbi:MAG: sigma-54 dependent transcriptional regulator, acetoin dehydrogenase operon transcriptional, partial [Paraburkholderia sp.]|nr:sigma-54 dependent transcriptional regulator, acetoin dehydrogenase operon transcriptional [Paraburkholderia sp.]
SAASAAGGSLSRFDLARANGAAPRALDTPATPARMDEWQSTLIAQTLARHSGNVSAAARELGLARNTVYKYLRRSGTH